MRLTTSLALLTASISTLASTQTIAQTERELGSHEHGSAFLNIAVDDNQVFLELETPWDNLVGFEHAPSTDEQHELVDNAMALLNKPEQLFSLDGGGCTVHDAIVESGLASGDDHHDEHGDDHDKEEDEHHDDDAHGDDHDKEEDEHHDDDAHGDEHDKEEDEHHDDDAHGDEHDKEEDEHHDGDAHGDHDDHGDEETHAEVLATYTFDCTDVNQLSAINVTFLEQWSGFEDLDVQLIGPGGQAALELGQSESLVDITQVQ